ncbi:hypothetical protein QQF64_020666 [Cirrhinus molitorella]|uniref:Uncharacterized protein n=1 Tax=Cirrhinus molitorella TaxID=172907 RepID=A0ABR3LC53_9TELE
MNSSIDIKGERPGMVCSKESRPSWDRQQPELCHVLQTPGAPGSCVTQSVQTRSDHLLLAAQHNSLSAL